MMMYLPAALTVWHILGDVSFSRATLLLPAVKAVTKPKSYSYHRYQNNFFFLNWYQDLRNNHHQGHCSKDVHNREHRSRIPD